MPGSNMWDAPIPGASLTKAPGSMAWQKPPKYTKLDDACNFIFSRMTQESQLHHLLFLMKQKTPLEAIARTVIMAGFSEGLWTPDLGLMLGHPVMYMLAAIAKRAGIDTPVTSTDRSGLKELVNFKRQTMTAHNMPSVEPQQKQPTPQVKPRGLLQPVGMNT